MALPTFCVILIYLLIYKRLRKMSSNLSNGRFRKSKKVRTFEETTSNNYMPTEAYLNNYATVHSSTAFNFNIETLKAETQITETTKFKRTGSNRTFRNCRKTQTRFANQFLAINFCLIISFLALSLGSMRSVVKDLNDNYYFITQILRVINILAAALIPIFSLFYPKSVFKSVLK